MTRMCLSLPTHILSLPTHIVSLFLPILSFSSYPYCLSLPTHIVSLFLPVTLSPHTSPTRLWILHLFEDLATLWPKYDCRYNTHGLIKSAEEYRISRCTFAMGWLRLVGSLKLHVSFAEYLLFYRALLQKRLIILISLLIVATPYQNSALEWIVCFPPILNCRSSLIALRKLPWLLHTYAHTHIRTHTHT